MTTPPPARESGADQQLEESGSDTATSSANLAPLQPWQPIGSTLERLFQSFDFVPAADEDDPRWKRWHARPGDLVEVRGRQEPIGRYFVTHASPLYFKLEDRRVFDQRGWPIVSGKSSPIRARKVRS